MKWYHFSVEYFEDLRNVNHCEFLIMRKKEDSGKYILENNLRTWSDLKRERRAAAAAAAGKEKGVPATTAAASMPLSEKDREKEKKLYGFVTDGGPPGVSSPTTIPIRKKWGGCPNGCDHGKHHFKKENSMHAMQLNGRPSPVNSPTSLGPGEVSRRPIPARRWQSSSEEDEGDPHGRVGAPLDVIDADRKSLDEVVSSPVGPLPLLPVEERLRNRGKAPKSDLLAVRATIGARSIARSVDALLLSSDTEFSAEEDTRKRLAKGKSVTGFRGVVAPAVSMSQLRKLREEAGQQQQQQQQQSRGGALADALGDQSDVGSDAGSEADPEPEPEPEGPEVAEAAKELADVEKEEKQDRSIKGSVY